MRRAGSLLRLDALACAVAIGVVAPAALLDCSSSTPTPDGCTAGAEVACTCANGLRRTQACGNAVCTCGVADASADDDAGVRIGDGGHVIDGATPTTLYGACARRGSFGWPCSNEDALDPTECTDPSFPYCFAGGQGSWCTATCGDAGFAAACLVEDAGCVPSACNTKGYCK